MNRSIFFALCVVLGACADAAPPTVADATPPTVADATPPTVAGAAPPTVAAAPAAPAAATVRTVDVATLQADLARGAVPLLVDVRTPAEFAAGHVSGARNVPLGELDGRLGEFGAPDGEVYVICQSGGRSAKASATLAGQGFRPVNVTGGTGAWVSAGYPVLGLP